MTRMTGAALLDYVRERMRQSSYYQPLVIRSLIRAGGSLSREELAKDLLLEDQFAVTKSVRTLMRWPKAHWRSTGLLHTTAMPDAFSYWLTSTKALASCLKRLLRSVTRQSETGSKRKRRKSRRASSR